MIRPAAKRPRPMLFPLAVVVLLLGGAATIALAPAALATERVVLDHAAIERAGVTLEYPAKRLFGDEIRVLGRVVRSPGAAIDVKTVLAGRVETIHVAPGQSVERGQPLLTLHSHDLHEMQSELLAADAAHRLAEGRVAAGRQLFALEGISRLELERRELEALTARLALRRVETELEDLGYSEDEISTWLDTAATHPTLTIRAPESGAVLELNVQKHGWLQPFDSLVVLGHPRQLELHLQIPPRDAARVAQGDRVLFFAVGRPDDSPPSRARVLTPVPQIDPATRTVTIRAEIEDGMENLLPGLFIEGTLACGLQNEVLSVPQGAVIRLRDSDIVFVHHGDGTFEARPVVLGRFDGTHYEAVSGLAEGEEIANAGVFLLKSALLRAAEEGP